MAAAVYFSETFGDDAIGRLFDKALADTGGRIGKEDRVAVKLHFGEEGNTRFVSPANLRPLLVRLARQNVNHFLTDANALYRGRRHNATDHLELARRHGFGALGVPILIADGERGEEETAVPIAGKIFRTVRIARRIAEARALVVVSHFKGHILFGFGGAIKNLGMGCGSRAGKLEMHSTLKPSIGEGCTLCGRCVEVCPADAILLGEDRAVIDPGKCEGCASCIAACEFDAVEIPWMALASSAVMERTAEYALGAVNGKPCVCVTFVNNIAKDCDCMADSELIGRDVGIVASVDPVACEQAAFDLVKARHGDVDIFKNATRMDGTHILAYAESIGLGRRDYSLIRL
ncbi:MAG: DUF362 domain-containing protein [Syntrophaceae bacterium]|nr:DUF362 domain-containing protein [Syntrophaceae bacterium]